MEPTKQLLLFDVAEADAVSPTAETGRTTLGRSPLEPYGGFLERCRIAELQGCLGGPARPAVAAGWFTEIEKTEAFPGTRWGFFTDGFSTIPMIFGADPPEVKPGRREAYLVRGVLIGSRPRFALSMLWRGRDRVDSPPVPEWLEGLPLFLIQDC